MKGEWYNLPVMLYSMPVGYFFKLMRDMFDLLPGVIRSLCTVVIFVILFLSLLNLIRN